ncbi:methyltransferase type 11 [Rhodoferax koreense]|uniref:Methyltransferase type 11 n=1 Tax=Rhodoferax koreensis TaxID=1842727 RepID=A0A1P8JRA8_9BURK|nr:methyltransferase domain-containing protein [Rhodoferax koreense]APW36292.1 methyltransferase type 11 [Rhodoferax koreense]
MLHHVSADLHRPSATTAHAAALAQYRQRADVYDLEMALWEPIRREAIHQLALRPGQTVLDVGCGTGLSFGPLVQALGAHGRVIGIEQSPDMLAKARARVAGCGWGQVELLCSPVANAPIQGMADAALFHFTHDILQQPAAITQVLRHLKPGARVVASGLKWAGPWNWFTNFFVWPAALHSVTSFDGLDQPWRQLAWHLPDMDFQIWLNDGVYIASGIFGEQGV